MRRWRSFLPTPSAAAGSRTSRNSSWSNPGGNNMDLKLKGKTALITGGSEGIGKGIAFALAKEGVDLAICARRKEPLDEAAQEIAKATGRKVVPITADLCSDKDAKSFIEPAPKAL